jgi:hypothetical protein
LAEATKSIRSDLSQSRVVQPKVMRDLVAQNATNHRAYLPHRAAAYFDWTLVDADLVWQDEAVVAGAFRLWDAVIETQEVRWVAYTGELHRFLIWPVLDDDLDVVQFLLEEVGERDQGLGHEMLKGTAIHSSIIASNG